jgi:hypothetical protein
MPEASMDVLKPGRPEGWGAPRLTWYLENLWANSVATFANMTEAHRLCLIDDVMVEIATGWKGGSPNPQTIVPLMMFFRSHSAFRAAAALGMGGATVEGLAILRLSLEFCGYAALIAQEPALANVWWDRDVGAEEQKLARRSFQHGLIVAAIEKYDAKLAEIYDDLYDRVIQFGAHPNEKSITANLKLEVRPEQTRLDQVYLQADGGALDHWLRTANQVGIALLKVFGHVHPARYCETGVGERIKMLSDGL